MRIACIDIGGMFLKSGVLKNGVFTAVTQTPTRAADGAHAMLETVAAQIGNHAGICWAQDIWWRSCESLPSST